MPITHPCQPPPAWRDSRLSAARGGLRGRSCLPSRKVMNKKQETAHRGAVVLGLGRITGSVPAPHSLAAGYLSGPAGMTPGAQWCRSRRGPTLGAAGVLGATCFPLEDRRRAGWALPTVTQERRCEGRHPCAGGVTAGLSDEERFEPRPEDSEEPACRGRRKDIPAKGPAVTLQGRGSGGSGRCNNTPRTGGSHHRRLFLMDLEAEAQDQGVARWAPGEAPPPSPSTATPGHVLTWWREPRPLPPLIRGLSRLGGPATLTRLTPGTGASAGSAGRPVCRWPSQSPPSAHSVEQDRCTPQL